MRLLRATLTGALLAGLVGCAGTSAPTTTPESTVPVATIRVADETFRVRLGTQALVQAARAAQVEQLLAAIAMRSGDRAVIVAGDTNLKPSRGIDGATLLDDWTWHAPRTAVATLDLAEARDVTLEIDHFELDGFSVLRLVIDGEPAVKPWDGKTNQPAPTGS